jgi:tetratricopeptide (TPR) repeat protein
MTTLENERRSYYERWRHREMPKDPEKSNSFLTIGKEFQKLNDDESAYRALQRAIRFNSDNAEAHLLLARISFREKRFRRAERHLSAAKKLDPKNSDVWVVYGMLLNREEPGYVRNVKDSTKCLQKALKLGIANKKLEKSTMGLVGINLRELKKHTESLKIFQKLNKLDPKDADGMNVLYEIGICYSQLKKPSKGYEFFLKSFKENPDKAEVLFALTYANLHRRKKYNEALKFAEKLVKLDPKNPMAWVMYCQVLVNIGKKELALTVADDALFDQPKEPVLLLQKALVLHLLKRFREEIAIYDLLLRVAKVKELRLPSGVGVIQTVVILESKGDALLELKDNHGLLEHAKTALEIKPNDPRMLWYLGMAYENMGQLNKALKVFEKIVKLDQDHSDAAMSLVMVCAKMNKWKKLVQASKNMDLDKFYNAIRKKPKGDVGYQLTLQVIGHAYHNTNKPKLAISIFDKALEKDPTSASIVNLQYKAHNLIHLRRFKAAYDILSKLSERRLREHGLNDEVLFERAFCLEHLKRTNKKYPSPESLLARIDRKSVHFKNIFDNCFAKHSRSLSSFKKVIK